MYRIIVTIVTITVVCAGKAAPPRVTCGPVPDSVRSCLGNPQILNHDTAKKCPLNNTPTQCATISCIASNAGWTNATNWLDLQRVNDFFTQYAKDHPEWSNAVEQVKSRCLAGPLPAQGAYLNCPTYDIFYCALAAFYKNAESKQWGSGAECDNARAFVAACPICPSECFAVAIPTGSCNLCLIV